LNAEKINTVWGQKTDAGIAKSEILQQKGVREWNIQVDQIGREGGSERYRSARLEMEKRKVHEGENGLFTEW